MDICSSIEKSDREGFLYKNHPSNERRDNKDLVRFMLSNLHEAVFICKWGQNGHIPIIDVNSFGCNYLSYEHEELIEKNLYDLFALESKSIARKNFRTFSIENNDLWEAIILTKDERMLQVEVKTHTVIVESGKLLLLSFRDISINKQVLNEMNNYKQLLERTEVIGKIGFWEFNLNTGNFWASSGTQSLFGVDHALTLEEVKELGISEFSSQIDTTQNVLIIVNKLYDAEFQIPGPTDNSLIYLHSIAEYDYTKKKIFGIIKNVSEQKKLETELMKAKEKIEGSDCLKRAFFSNMSHEIRTPMNGIIGFSELLTQGDLPAETKAEYKEYISHSCNNLLNVINSIIDISRIETDQVTMQSKYICISEFLNSILETYKCEAAKKNLVIRLNPNIHYKDYEINSDEAKLNQILSNFIDNAIRFTSKGYIEIGCMKRGYFLEFYVKDTGIGISPSDHEIIFEPFRQGEDSTSEYFGRTGLGLTISRSFVKMLGGSIWVDSMPGEGSTFYFTIPYDSNIKDSVESGNIEISYDSKDIKTCLIVDDLEMNYIYLEALLSSSGFNVLWAKDGDEAIFKSINEPVDIVLMDLKMPNINGYEATKSIKRKRPDLPIIAQTACALRDEKSRALEAGCDDFILKPINKEEFIKKVDAFFNSDK